MFKTKFAAVKCIHCGKYHDVVCNSEQEWKDVEPYNEPEHLKDTVDHCSAVMNILRGQVKLNPGYGVEDDELTFLDCITKEAY